MNIKRMLRGIILGIILVTIIMYFNLPTLYGCILAILLVLVGDELLKLIPYLKDK